MGLDMYFEAHHYVSGWKEKIATPAIFDELGLNECHYMNECYNVGYFRKFNALHNYIVEHCANGEDDCRPVYVDSEVVKRIYDRLVEIDKDHTKAPELLPVSEGFFFGSTEYDEYYFEDIKDGIDLFGKLLKLLDTGEYDIWYCASW